MTITTNTTWAARRARAVALALAITSALAIPACGGGGSVQPDAGPEDAPDAGPPGFAECAADDASFVRNAHLAVLGYRPRSQAEVDVYVEIMRQVAELEADGQDVPDPREVAMRAMMNRPEYVERWVEQIMDALRVPRIEDQRMEPCYGRTARAVLTEFDPAGLAAFVRDNPGTGGGDGRGAFTMRDLLQSALVLDDISPVYRAHLYALVSRPIPAANVPRVEAELARREDFGLVFDSAYLNRDIVCLGCHNSAGSVTFNPDPELNRHFALPGLFERAVYGADTGVEVERAHAPFRFDGFVADVADGDFGQEQPWGWAGACGGFNPEGLPPDPAGVDAVFASLSGDRTTVYDLEGALKRGFDRIAQNGLSLGDGGEIADPDAAFAYMVAAAIVEAVWIEVIGSPLTIANYFARNAASRDLLLQLTTGFIESRFSLRQLLVDIALQPYFNRLPPEAGCGEGPFNMPPVYDPWVTSDEDPERRLNGPADGVAAMSGRTLMRAAYAALEWKPSRFQSFPQPPSEMVLCEQFSCATMGSICASQGVCCVAHDIVCVNPPGPDEPTASQERAFQLGIGVFLKNGERGFRGLDFQARLVWEERFGACAKPTGDDDLVDAVLAQAAARGGTVRDVAVAIKDRLTGEPFVAPGEAALIEAIFGSGLDAEASSVPELEVGARRLCGALLSSPQFLLAGVAGRGGEAPRLTPPAYDFDSVCAGLAPAGLGGGLKLSCEAGALTVSR